MQAVVLAVLAALACCGVPQSEGANILALLPLEGRSHWIVFRELLVELTRRGHHLTVMTPFHEKGDPWEHIHVKASFGSGSQFNFLSFGSMTTHQQFIFLFQGATTFCHGLMENKGVQELIDTQDKKFDLVLIETFFHDCLLAFAHKFKAPIVSACAFGGGSSWINYMVGNPYPLSYISENGLTYGTDMNLFQRAHNAYVSLSLQYHRQYVYLPALDELIQKHFKDPTMPPLAELERNTSLLLLNTHFSFDYVRPLMPNAVQVAGMHIKPPKKLPQDLQKFMDAATDGVIYFSMGSNIRSAALPEDLRKAFLNTFAKLKQKVIWKFETESLPDQPPNVMISKWFPQSDILAHKNVKFFITHGGMMSLQEALYSGVPLLGFPIFGDQEPNLCRAQKSGYALMLHITNITEESFGWAVNELITNPRYMESAKKYSRLFHDRPEKPLDTAAYWVEYVLRHNGARHMRSAALDLAWYQYFLLDVILFLLLIAMTLLVAAALAVKFVLRKIFGGSGTAKRKKTTKKD